MGTCLAPYESGTNILRLNIDLNMMFYNAGETINHFIGYSNVQLGLTNEVIPLPEHKFPLAQTVQCVKLTYALTAAISKLDINISLCEGDDEFLPALSSAALTS
jgi:hypothetical protein